MMVGSQTRLVDGFSSTSITTSYTTSSTPTPWPRPHIYTIFNEEHNTWAWTTLGISMMMDNQEGIKHGMMMDNQEGIKHGMMMDNQEGIKHGMMNKYIILIWPTYNMV